MSRIFKTSGFLGLTTMMVVGLYQNYLIATGGTVPQWLIGGHAHLGVLSILAIALGVVLPAFEMRAAIERIVTWAFVVGQWALPLTVWLAAGFELEFLHPTAFLWGLLLVLAMGIMTWQSAIQPAERTGERGGSGASPADD